MIFFWLLSDLVAMLMDPISFANRALQDMAEGLVSIMCIYVEPNCMHACIYIRTYIT